MEVDEGSPGSGMGHAHTMPPMEKLERGVRANFEILP